MLKKIFNLIKLYILQCLITPMLISLGVVLAVYVFFHFKINLVYSVFNMLVYAEPQKEEEIYKQAMTAIIGNTAPEVEITYPQYGDKFAELTIESLNKKDEAVFNCDDYSQLKYGWGHSLFTRYPGEGGKIVLAGHSMANKNLYDIKIGVEIALKTNYGTFRYNVTQKELVDKDDQSIMKADDSKEQLLLYSCYPLNTVGAKSQRLIVFSELVSGPVVKNIPFKD